MEVCVIGAGPSGLTTIKQLKDEGHSVTCFEQNAGIGGIWHRSVNPTDDMNRMKVYDDLILTISMGMMAYSDFMVKGKRTFYNRTQYQQYLEAYADQYDLRKHIRLNSEVNEIKKTTSQKWLVKTTSDGQSREQLFDAVAVCNGPFHYPEMRTVPNLDKFSGKVIHSSLYRNNKQFAGKRVLVVGLAESGADILREISNVASETTLSIHSYTFLLPRIFSGKFPTDTLTTRFHHYEMYVRSQFRHYPYQAIFGKNLFSRFIFMTFAWFYAFVAATIQALSGKKEEDDNSSVNPLGQPAKPTKIDIDCELTKEHFATIDEWNRRSSNYEGTWSAKRIICKNVSFIPNIVNKKIMVNDAGIDRIDGNRVYFKNNETKEYDIIMLCTGFKKDFAALGQDLSVQDDNVRNLYKHAFHPDHGGRLAFIGFVRPLTGGIPIASEMQARYFAQLCSNKLKLPSNLHQVIREEKEWEDAMVFRSPRQDEAIPSQALFIDSIAKEVGCLMPIHQLIFKPRLLVKHWFGTYNQTSYRLVGPHKMPSAMKTLMGEKQGPLASLKPIMKFFILLISPSFVHPKYNENASNDTP